MSDIRNINHWIIENYRQRITVKQWRKILLDNGDTFLAKGRMRKLVGKKLGSGIIEIYKEPLEEK